MYLQITDWIMVGVESDRPAARTGGASSRLYIQTDAVGSGIGIYYDDGITGAWSKIASVQKGKQAEDLK